MVDFDNQKEKTAPLYEHLRRSFEYTATHLGPHKLPLIGRADWNDCLNLNCFPQNQENPSRQPAHLKDLLQNPYLSQVCS